MAKSQPHFNPDEFMQNWSTDRVPSHDNGISFRQCIIKAFSLPEDDNYEYKAQGVTTLDITQRAIHGKRAHGLHDWYHDEHGKLATPPHPTPPEITAYTSLFFPSIALPKALNAFKNSAKASTLQSPISTHLSSSYHTTPLAQGLLPTKPKSPRSHTNPYLDLWAYSCEELEWAGPWPATSSTRISHHILPVLYHHFGCLVPSFAALHIIARLAQPRKPSTQPVKPILDVGSGNGYWTLMLRQFPAAECGMKRLLVCAVDNQVSTYRTTWVNDTVVMDAVRFLREGRIRSPITMTSKAESASASADADADKNSVHERAVDSGRGCILLLVYPQATGTFTSSVLKAYKGDTIVVAGTQNGNGFTGFVGEMVESWVEREMGEFELVLRVPVPSFAGKDEGLCVFRRRGSDG
ncbi:hypothetical protein K491DRAFT_720441 [Lophiostoma macrostomum CBS 122681]|uniref:Methyltransferase domain-containing protein n=1 Tax=Lophiostoma macrostomum CBS 122681 TaxID=1314788 RepID=A0A6A6SW21_9PLEO|nr:hypothetical protein K491DRAFT_720441 [Lophiostoma macrostomum CBS 122681]